MVNFAKICHNLSNSCKTGVTRGNVQLVKPRKMFLMLNISYLVTLLDFRFISKKMKLCDFLVAIFLIQIKNSNRSPIVEEPLYNHTTNTPCSSSNYGNLDTSKVSMMVL